MSDIKKALEEMSNLVNGELESVRSEMKEVKQDSGRFAELGEKHDRVLAEFDKLQEKMDSMQVAMNRAGGVADSEKEINADVVEHKAAFDHYLRTAQEGDLRNLEAKTLSVGSDPDGGYVAPEEMSSQVIKTIYETSPLRQIANVMNTARKEVEFLVDKDEAGAQWVAEEGTVTDATTPQLGKLKIPVHKLATEPMATTEILADAEIDLESWLAAKVAEKFARSENSAFVNGNGVGKPRGFTTYASGTAWEQIEQVETAASTVLDELDLLELMASLKDGYLPGASWAMSRHTNKVIRKLQDNDGNFLFTGQDLMDNTLFGYPIIRLEDMAKPTSGSTYTAGDLPVAFGNFNIGYTIVDRAQVTILRDPFTSKGYVKFYTTRRTGGAITNFEAIKLLSIKA